MTTSARNLDRNTHGEILSLQKKTQSNQEVSQESWADETNFQPQTRFEEAGIITNNHQWDAEICEEWHVDYVRVENEEAVCVGLHYGVLILWWGDTLRKHVLPTITISISRIAQHNKRPSIMKIWQSHFIISQFLNFHQTFPGKESNKMLYEFWRK